MTHCCLQKHPTATCSVYMKKPEVFILNHVISKLILTLCACISTFDYVTLVANLTIINRILTKEFSHNASLVKVCSFWSCAFLALWSSKHIFQQLHFSLIKNRNVLNTCTKCKLCSCPVHC